MSFITGLKCTSEHEVIHLPISDIEIKVFIQQNFHEVRVEELTTWLQENSKKYSINQIKGLMFYFIILHHLSGSTC